MQSSGSIFEEKKGVITLIHINTSASKNREKHCFLSKSEKYTQGENPSVLSDFFVVTPRAASSTRVLDFIAGLIIFLFRVGTTAEQKLGPITTPRWHRVEAFGPWAMRRK